MKQDDEFGKRVWWVTRRLEIIGMGQVIKDLIRLDEELGRYIS